MVTALLAICWAIAALTGLWCAYMLIDWLSHGRPDRFR
jgi:hypothetical protein